MTTFQFTYLIGILCAVLGVVTGGRIIFALSLLLLAFVSAVIAEFIQNKRIENKRIKSLEDRIKKMEGIKNQSHREGCLQTAPLILSACTCFAEHNAIIQKWIDEDLLEIELVKQLI